MFQNFEVPEADLRYLKVLRATLRSIQQPLRSLVVLGPAWKCLTSLLEFHIQYVLRGLSPRTDN